MNKTFKNCCNIFVFALTSLSINSAYAATSAYIIPGSRAGTSSGIINFSSGDVFLTRVAKDHSAYCRYLAAGTIDVDFLSSISCTSGTCPTPTLTGTLAGLINGGFDFGTAANDAISFISTGNAEYQITNSFITGGTNNAAIECYDTTLFGNFNTVTVANPFNFLEVTNDTDTSASVLVVVTNNAGTEISRFNVTLTARQQRDISIHDISGASNTFGSILLSHNSIPNGIRASVTKYTSAFAITASTPLVTQPNSL